MSLGTRQSNQGLRTQQAKRMLVRHIWESNLQQGDRLPSYAALRERLQLGDATISRAVRSLEQEGVLQTVNRVGTFVVDSQAGGYSGWVVGLAALRTGDNGLGPFYSCLLHNLQVGFRAEGCKTEIYYQNRSDSDVVGLDDLPGLERSVDQNEISGVVLTSNLDADSWASLEASGVCPYFVGAPTSAVRGTFIDYQDACEQMAGDLIGRGCRNPALILPATSVLDQAKHISPEFAELFGRTAPRGHVWTAAGMAGGRLLADQVLSMPPEARPDGLVIADDQIATGLMNKLAREDPHYKPHFCVLTNSRIEFDAPFKNVRCFEVNLQVLVESATHNVMKLLRGGKIETDRVQIKARRNTKDCFSDVG